MLSVRPSKLIAVHLNYRSRAVERGRIPENPSYFLKAPSTLADHRDVVERPEGCSLLAFEGEIALVMGRDVKRVAPEDAWACVSGVAAANDLGVYDFKYADPGSNVHSKGFDGFTPVGPSMLAAADVDPLRLRVRSWLNGELAQDALVSDDMLFDPCFVIADLARVMTLFEGDVILLGTPTGSSVCEPGDEVSVEVSAGELSTGRLINSIGRSSEPLLDCGAMPRVDEATEDAAYSTAVGRLGADA